MQTFLIRAAACALLAGYRRVKFRVRRGFASVMWFASACEKVKPSAELSA